jgi:asparagine synthase (glutamine-hydrolysing)
MYKNWRREGNPPWHNFSAIHPEFAARSGVVNRAAQEHLPFDAPPLLDGRRSRIEGFHCYCETADWLASVRAGFGVDYRIPAFDRRLVEFCIGIPEDQFLRGGRERWLIKRAMKGRLPDIILGNRKRGAQAADWYPRMTRERNHIVEVVKRFAANPEVASIVDVQRLIAILDNWPDRQPPEYSVEHQHLLTLPGALGAAYFIENVTGTNYGRLPQASSG